MDRRSRKYSSYFAGIEVSPARLVEPVSVVLGIEEENRCS